MSQITHGIRSALASPMVYTFFQKIMGADKVRSWLINDVIQPKNGMNILDVGCGPADILDELGEVNYWGYDISDLYIKQAQRRYGRRGDFFCKLFTEEDIKSLPQMDIIIMIGVLHHLDDEDAMKLINMLSKVIKDGGRLLTLDACHVKDQNLIARYLISKDRGQNVRNEFGYLSLMSDSFSSIHKQVKHQFWIPYTHCLLVARK